jgi:hypothetical protein
VFRLDADWHVANVDVNAAPLEYRTGDKLKRIFFKARALFTTLYARWTVSGQNDPETFVNYLPTAPRSPEISTEGKRAHILFIAMSCGTLEEDADALNFTKKTVPDGVGYDYMNDQIVCEVREVRPSKRSRCTTAPQDDALHQFSDILVEKLQPLLSVESAGAVGGSSGALQSADTDSLLQKFENVAARLQEIEERNRAGSSRTTDAYFREQLEKRLQTIKDDLEKDC